MRWIVTVFGLFLLPYLVLGVFVEDVFGGEDWLVLLDEILETRCL